MKIAIDLGHGIGQDRGANGIIAEESIIDSVGHLVAQGLKAHSSTVFEVRPKSARTVNDSLNQRSNISDSFGADLLVSIHANASNGVGHGVEVWTMNAKKLPQAVDVCNNIAALGIANRGIKDGSHLAVIKNTKAPAMLIEICFCDNADDVAWFNRVGAQAIANAIVSAVIGTASKIPSPPQAPRVAPPNQQGNDWVRRLQSECNAQGYSGQAVDGILGVNTLNGCPLIKHGSQGNITRLMQEKLVNLGYNTNGIDGDFGEGTYNAVVAFQRDNGLSQDGVVGRNTWSKILGL